MQQIIIQVCAPSARPTDFSNSVSKDSDEFPYVISTQTIAAAIVIVVTIISINANKNMMI